MRLFLYFHTFCHVIYKLMQKLRLVYFAISNQGLYNLPYQNQGLYFSAISKSRLVIFGNLLPQNGVFCHFSTCNMRTYVYIIHTTRNICSSTYRCRWLLQDGTFSIPTAHFLSTLTCGAFPKHLSATTPSSL